MLAEVADKVPSVTTLWAHVVAAALCLVLSRFAVQKVVPGLVLLALAWGLFFVWLIAGEDQLSGDIAAELGWGYCATVFTPLFAVLIGRLGIKTQVA
jgi:hypothetical protein